MKISFIIAIVALIIISLYFFMSSMSYEDHEAFVRKHLSEEAANEALLYHNGALLQSYQANFGSYPADLAEIESKGRSISSDVFSSQLPRYVLSENKQGFDLRFTGKDGVFDTDDDVVYDASRLADNSLPMYGGESRIKSSQMLLLDNDFIDTTVQEAGSREDAFSQILSRAQQILGENDLDTAMARFNQAWLLNPEKPEPYKGFAEILKRQGKTKESNIMAALAVTKDTAAK